MRERKMADVMFGAREVFFRRGYEGASVDAIAAEGKVSKATMYSY
ncbi:MAG: helix-turn-helix transcriptional regulator, partial [Oricola sp.]|nr:helix-turn-helix transcriptional regulator [Oricola sp.]